MCNLFSDLWIHKLKSPQICVFFCLNRKVRTYSEGSYSQVMSNDTISSSCTTFGCCYLILVSMLWLLLYLNVVLNSTIECNTKCAIPALSVLLKYCVFLLSFFHLIPYFHSFLSSYLFSQRRGNHWHPRGWPVVCHHAKINANSLSLSLWDMERGTISSLHPHCLSSALGPAGWWAKPSVHLLSTGCCMSMEGMFLLLSPLSIPDIFPVFSERRHCWTWGDTDRQSRWKNKKMTLKKVIPSVPVLSIINAGSEPPSCLSLPAETNDVREKKKTKNKRKKCRKI